MERARVYQKISFCDRAADNIVDETTKHRVLALASAAAPRRAFHHGSADPARLKEDVRRGSFLTERSIGNPYLLVLSIVHGVESAIFVDRKVNRAGEYTLPRMVRANLFFAEEVFPDNGAVVIDGEMVRVPDPRNPQRAREWRFLVNGVLGARGDDLFARMAAAAAVLERRTRTPLDPCVFECKRIFSATAEGARGMREWLATRPYPVRGVYLWAATSPTPTLFSDDPGPGAGARGRLEKGRVLAASPASVAGLRLADAPAEGEVSVEVRSTEIPDRFLLPDGSLLAVPGAAVSALLREKWRGRAIGAPLRLVLRGGVPATRPGPPGARGDAARP